jgi:hypothetical protein
MGGGGGSGGPFLLEIQEERISLMFDKQILPRIIYLFIYLFISKKVCENISFFKKPDFHQCS